MDNYSTKRDFFFRHGLVSVPAFTGEFNQHRKPFVKAQTRYERSSDEYSDSFLKTTIYYK